MAEFLNHKKQNIQMKRLKKKKTEDMVKLSRLNAHSSFISAPSPNLIKMITKK